MRFPASILKAVPQVDDAAVESVLVDELKIGAVVGRQCGVPPTEDDWPDEQSSSTNPATRACAARFGPPTNRSLLAAAFRSSTAPGSKWRSIRVFAVGSAARVEE